MDANPEMILQILVVEDHDQTRQCLSNFFGRRGHLVKVAKDLQEGVTMLSSGTFDLLVSDVGLPDGSGYELLRSNEPKRVAFAVAISGYGSRADRVRTEEAGFDGHLVKPVSFAELDRVLCTAKMRAGEIRP
jgi:DNA-binding response OmpR family regulator